MEFVGWTPNATGRLSFTQIGNQDSRQKASVCNRTAAEEACLLVAQVRTSSDGPIPAFLLRSKRISKAHFVANFWVAESDLPYTKPNSSVPEMWSDARGSLQGHVLVVLCDPRGSDIFKERFAEFSRVCRQGGNPHLDKPEVDALLGNVGESLSTMFNDLKLDFASHPETSHAFALAKVSLSRTGRTHISIESQDVFTSLKSKRQQLLETPNYDDNCFLYSQEALSRQIFHFIRDLAHRHYHHDPRADLATMPFEWTVEQDEAWRRETQYGLVRMAISARRENHVESYKQALGILAYAELFQSHLAGWRETEDGSSALTEYFPYDFSALRESIRASTSVLDERHKRGRESFLFVAGTCLTAAGLVLASGHVWEIPQYKACIAGPIKCEHLAFWFWWTTKWCVDNPFTFIVSVTFLAILEGVFSQRVMRSNRFIAALNGGLSRFSDAVMGQIAARAPPDVALAGGLVSVFFLAAALFSFGFSMVLLARSIFGNP